LKIISDVSFIKTHKKSHFKNALFR